MKKEEEKHVHARHGVHSGNHIYFTVGRKKLLKITGILILLSVILFFLSFLFLNFFYFKTCSSSECFNSQLMRCAKTLYLSEGKNNYQYLITGIKDEECVIKVTLLGGDFSDSDLSKLKGKSMDCYIPLGVVMSPESDINNCHGELKETLQDIIINRLNVYLVDNVGKINYDIYKSLTQNTSKK